MNACAISQYWSQARVALPTLSNLVAHPWTDFSAEAQIAIRKITAIAKDVSQ